MRKILPTNPAITYSGRIDFTDPDAPVFIYAASFFKVKFTGKECRLIVKNHHCWARNFLGIFLDGVQGKIELFDDDKEHVYDLKDCIRTEIGSDFESESGNEMKSDRPDEEFFKNFGSGEHEIMVFKRQDGGQHYVTFCGLEIEDGGSVSMVGSVSALPSKKLEVIGDSVSCGEVCEAIDCVASPDPENNEGRFSNSWYSYSWQVARMLDMELHDTSQGGISLLDGTGWFNGPSDLRGVESCYEKLKYNPALGENNWDCSKWIPDVIVIAIGQNDSSPVDIMKNDYESAESRNWRAQYEAFIKKLQGLYPGVTIVCATTLLMHDRSWDDAIEEVVRKVNAENAEGAEGAENAKGASAKVYHFLYKRNGAATPGHPRIPEHNEMAAELAEFLREKGF